MLEKVLKGRPSFYIWLAFLGAVITLGGLVYLYQLFVGLRITDLSRDVSWGFYIAQFTYMVGVAASAVMLVLPAYFHNYKKFKKMIILGEFLAIGACVVCMLFIFVDLGQPQRVLNVILHPSPNSVMFWDMVVLSGYLLLNILIGWVTLEAERHQVDPPNWIKTFIYLSIFWAFSIHTVTAFLYAGLPGRHYWLTAIMAARFLASAFCSGPALLLLLVFIVRSVTGFDPGRDAIRTLTKIVAYAMGINIFLFLLELFTASYSQIPALGAAKTALFFGHEGQAIWINKWAWASVVLALLSFLLMAFPSTRDNEKILPYTLLMLVVATWIDKSLVLLWAGFTPTPFDTIADYAPSLAEILIGLGVYGIGALIVSILWKIALEVKKEAGTFSAPA
jgi:molybdopterin-containing oxidoreductase family membrane subunit